MEREIFGSQIERLKAEWPHSYGPEKVRVFWETFRKESNDVFSRAVTRCFATCRSAPLVKELGEAIDWIKREDLQSRQTYGMQGAGFVHQLEAAARKTTADRDFVKGCMKHLWNRLDGRISEADFKKGCDEIDSVASRIVRAGKVT
jgi:hypothetical protein